MNGNPQRSLSEFAISRRKLLVELGALAAVAGVGGRLFIPVARAQSAGGVFVGKIDGTNAFVGIVTDGQQAEAYVCNGVQFKELFTGTMAGDSNGRVTLLGEDGDLLPIDVNSNSLQDLLASGGSLTGALAIGGVSNAFRADPAMGPGAVYLSIGTLPDGSTMDGGTIVLNNGDFRGILDTIIGALGDAADAAATFLESGATPDEPGTIGLGEVLAAGVSALTGDTQGALNILNGCASGNEDPVLCPTANVNSVPLFTVSMTGGASGGGTPLGSTPASSAPGGGARPSSTPVSSTSGGGATPASGARGATATPVNGATASGAAAGSTSQVSQQPIAQAVKMMQSGQALSGPNGPQPVSVPVSVGNTTVNAMMVPQTPAKLTQNGPPH